MDAINSSYVYTVLLFQDYDYELVCVTEREKFIVPVRAIGARALLDFPDKVHFSASPVKVMRQPHAISLS